MALIYTLPADGIVSLGNKRMIIGSLALDNSYPTGGYLLSLSKLGLTKINYAEFEQAGGYEYVFNYTNNKFQVFSGASGSTGATSGGTPAGTVSAPTFVGDALAVHGHNITPTQDEVISVTAGTGVSAALINIPIGMVDSVFIDAGGVTGAAVKVPVGSVVNSKEVSINYTTGVLQFLVADAVTSAKVTYAQAAVSTTSAGTPSGTNSVPIFSGSALATHTHTIGAAAGSEIAGATDLSSVTALKFMVIGF